MSFSYNYGMDGEEVLGFLVIYLLAFLLSGGINIVCYVFRALGLYSIAKRRALSGPWMAWVPVLDYWLVGSISDQYQYVSKGKVKNKRKWMIGMSIAMAGLCAALCVVCIMMFAELMSHVIPGGSEATILKAISSPLIAILVLCLPMLILTIALMVVYYVAMYDVYRSLDPGNSVMFLVLSILFQITEPFFLFFNRKKDLGMPPRKKNNIYGKPGTEEITAVLKEKLVKLQKQYNEEEFIAQ